MRGTAFAAAAVLLVLAAGCGGSTHPAAVSQHPPASTPRLTGIAELRHAFNRDAGEPTLVVLVSPT